MYAHGVISEHSARLSSAPGSRPRDHVLERDALVVVRLTAPHAPIAPAPRCAPAVAAGVTATIESADSRPSGERPLGHGARAGSPH